MPRGFREGHKPWTPDSEGRRFKLSRFRKSVDKELNSEPLQNASCSAQNVSVATDGQISYQSKVTANLTNGDNPLVFDSKTSAENNASTSTSDHQSSYKLQNLSDFIAECLTPQGGSLNNSSEATDSSKNKPFLLPAFYGIPSMAGSVTGSVPSVSSLSQWLHLISDQEAGLVHQKKDITTEMHDLRDEVEKLHLHQRNWEKEASDLLHQKQHLEEELKREMNARQRAAQQITNLQRQLRTQEERVQELETTLSAAQQALDQRGLSDELDWIICRDEIHVTENCLGVGGWGTVLQGTFRGCKVAVKQIHELILSPHNRRLFEREMNIASKCRHPCLLQFIGATNDDGNPLFVTELMESSLRALLQERELSEKETSTISMDVALALNYLHLNKFPIAHRDVSSANVLLWRQGNKWRAKVSDYSTANFMRHTMTVAPGALIYCAPEALTSNQTIKMDVYSFGVLVCEICIRELPDPRRREEQVASVTNHVLRGLIRRCIQSEPGTRPTMEKVINHLEELSYN